MNEKAGGMPALSIVANLTKRRCIKYFPSFARHLAQADRQSLMAKHSASPHDFESALAEIDRLVSTMETGQIALDEALRAYERGVELLKYCRAILDGAEERLKIVDQSLADMESTSPESDT